MFGSLFFSQTYITLHPVLLLFSAIFYRNKNSSLPCSSKNHVTYPTWLTFVKTYFSLMILQWFNWVHYVLIHPHLVPIHSPLTLLFYIHSFWTSLTTVPDYFIKCFFILVYLSTKSALYPRKPRSITSISASCTYLQTLWISSPKLTSGPRQN